MPTILRMGFALPKGQQEKPILVSTAPQRDTTTNHFCRSQQDLGICCHPWNLASITSHPKGSWMFLEAQSHSRAAEREGREPDDIVSCSVSYDFQGGECWTKCFPSLGRAQLSSAAQRLPRVTSGRGFTEPHLQQPRVLRLPFSSLH